MKLVRSLLGLLALAAIIAGANLAVIKQTFFLVTVYVLLGCGLLAGIVWLVWVFRGIERRFVQEGATASRVNAVITSVLFLGICIVVYAFAAHWSGSWDLTKEGRRKLSDQTVQVMKVLDKDVAVVCFFLEIDDRLVAIARDKTRRFLDQCQQCTSHLKVEFLDPQIDRIRLMSMGISRASTQGTVIIRCGTRQKVITLSGGSPRLEERDFTNAIINVIRDSEPKVGFLTGHGERSIDDNNENTGGSTLKEKLGQETYKAERIAIMISQPEVPADCDVLVINGMGLNGPQGDLHPQEIRAIQAFLDRGGRLLILLDPWLKTIKTPNQVEQLLPWLGQKYGILVGSNVALSPSSRKSTEVEFSANVTPFGPKKPDDEFQGCFNAGHRITQNFDQKLVFELARTVGLAEKMPDKVAGVQLLRTTPDFYAETDIDTLTTQQKAMRSPDEKTGPLPMAVAVTAKTDFLVADTGQTRDARIVVVGDSDFASNGQLAVIPGNLNFLLNTMAWLTENEDLIAIRPAGKEDPPVMLSEFDQRMIVWIAVLGTVQAVIAASLVAYVLRRRHQ